MPAFTALNVSVEIPSSSSTLANPTLPSNAAKPTRRASAPFLSPSIRDLPPGFLYNTFPENGVRHSSEAQEKNKEAKGQAAAAYSAPAIDFCHVSIGERLTPQRSTHPDQRNCQPRSDCSVASIQAKLHTGAQKQKRKFTNRTKTGCLTCRKRKKKCDEAKPICNNCQRGNHACAGYPPPRIRGYVPTAIHPLPPRAHMLHPNTHSAATDPRVVAQMALSHLDVEQDRRLSVVPFTQRPTTEKEKMLAGHGYYQHDRELSLERDRAAMSCWLFNTLVKNGLSVEEHTRHFLDIIRAGRMPPPANEDAHTVPPQVVVEVPFHCDYGYNITIGRNVTIGRNCAFNDAGRIYIGDNSAVGPNVSIYTEERSTDPKYRQTYQSIQFGKAVMIDSDCWIGGSVTILPGKIIGKGATVMAGSVVAEDVPPFAVAAGNPARVLYSVAPL